MHVILECARFARAVLSKLTRADMAFEAKVQNAWISPV